MALLLDIQRSISQLGNKREFNFLSQDLGKIQTAIRQLQGAIPSVSESSAATPPASTQISGSVAPSASVTAINGISGSITIVGPGVAAQPGSQNIIIGQNSGGVIVNAPVAITNIVETAGSIVTLQCSPSSLMIVGSSIYLSGLSVGTWLNTKTVTLTVVTGTSITFVDPTSHGVQASAPETGNEWLNVLPAVSGHSGKLISFNGSVAATYELANPATSNTWWVAVQCVGSGGVTVNPNSLDLDGSGSSLTLTQGEGCLIYSDGTNYWTMRGIA